MNPEGFITCGHTDDALSAGKHLLRIDAFVGVALQVVHFAVAPGTQPVLELGRALRRVSRREAASVEPQIQGAPSDERFHRCDDWPRASRNWWMTCCTTSFTDRSSVLTRTSALR